MTAGGAVEYDYKLEEGRRMPDNIGDIKNTGDSSPADVAPIREVDYGRHCS